MVLQELLEEKKFNYLKVLNKKPDLSRAVMTVESTETPDVAEYIPYNTLLLMTGMAFQQNQLSLCPFLEELSRRSCAGVAIKLGRFIDKLDDRVLETADRLSLPLLQISMNVTLGEVYHEILAHIWDNQNDNLLNALNTQRKISNLILRGSSMKIIMNNMTAILNKAIMIVDMFGRIQDYGYTYSKTERLKSIKIMEKLMKSGSLEGDSYCLYEEGEKEYCIYPIRGVGRNTNFIIIQDFNPKVREEEVLVMEQVLMALELYFYRNLYVQYNHMRTQEEFLSILLEQLSDKTWTERQALSIGESYGLKQASAYQMVLISMDSMKRRKFNTNNFSRQEESYILIYMWIKDMINGEAGNNVLIFPQESEWRYVLLIQGRDLNMQEKYFRLHDYIEEKFSLSVTIAQGGVVSSLLNVKSSFKEAEGCMEDGNKNEKYPYLLSYKPRNMLELFKFVPERQVQEICTTTLKELAFPKNQMQEELRKTLETFLSCGSSITKASEKMFLHRNTIKYRIKKCEEILEVELSSASDCFHIQLALVLSETMR